MKVKMDSLEKQAKTLAQENERLRSDSAKMNKEISDLRSSIDDQARLPVISPPVLCSSLLHLPSLAVFHFLFCFCLSRIKSET